MYVLLFGMINKECVEILNTLLRIQYKNTAKWLKFKYTIYVYINEKNLKWLNIIHFFLLFYAVSLHLQHFFYTKVNSDHSLMFFTITVITR